MGGKKHYTRVFEDIKLVMGIPSEAAKSLIEYDSKRLGYINRRATELATLEAERTGLVGTVLESLNRYLEDNGFTAIDPTETKELDNFAASLVDTLYKNRVR